MDLDGAAQIFATHGWSPPSRPDRLFFSGLEAGLELLEAQGLRATLFVIADDLGDPAKLHTLRDAVARGHLVASHTISHRRLSKLSASEQRREIRDSKAIIEERLGALVGGFRAPGFDLPLSALRCVAETGYVYDSSLFPGRRRRPEGDLPHIEVSPQTVLGGSLVELPLPRYRPLPWPFHASYCLVLGSWYFRLGVRCFKGTGAPLVMLFHLTDFGEPVADSGGLKQAIFTLSHRRQDDKLSVCERMISEVKRSYRFVTTEQLLEEVRIPEKPA